MGSSVARAGLLDSRAMSYLVLARKYRPRTFEEVAGQDVLTRTLRGAIEAGRVGHAYLFCGPRGTGKTTTARILAKALICERGPTADPCGECERCLSLDAGSEADVVEIDAASHTSVENVRELRDQVAYSPMRARFKVYIIDEVHMLSRSAFNALLKTLEEPPAYAKFLFATTEPHKVPDTILSRCQVLKLSPLPEATIAARLEEIFGLEHVQAEAGVAQGIARRARGGMRDALSMADQLLALVGDRPRVADLARLSGAGVLEDLEQTVDRILAGDRAGVLRSLPAQEGEEGEYLDALLQYLRDALLVAHCGIDAPHLEQPPVARPGMVERARALGDARLALMLEELLHARERMRLMPQHARTALEVALLALCGEEASLPLEDLVRRLEALEARLASGAPPQAQAPARPTPAPAPVPDRAQRPSSTIEPAPRRAAANPRAARSSAAEAWTQFLADLAQRAPSLADVVSRRGQLYELAPGRAVVRLANLNEGEAALVQDGRNQKVCAKAFSEILGQPTEVRLEDAATIKPGRMDEFTQEVSDRFGGRIEDQR